jgi:hypothetical protein
MGLLCLSYLVLLPMSETLAFMIGMAGFMLLIRERTKEMGLEGLLIAFVATAAFILVSQYLIY